MSGSLDNIHHQTGYFLSPMGQISSRANHQFTHHLCRISFLVDMSKIQLQITARLLTDLGSIANRIVLDWIKFGLDWIKLSAWFLIYRDSIAKGSVLSRSIKDKSSLGNSIVLDCYKISSCLLTIQSSITNRSDVDGWPLRSSLIVTQ